MCTSFAICVLLMEKRTTVIDGFYALLRFSVGESEDFSVNLTSDEWFGVYQMAQQQALLGLLFCGVERNGHTAIPEELLQQWSRMYRQIRKLNAWCNRVAVDVSGFFGQHGIRNCILKGQGIALIYSDPSVRMCGDIDVWVEGGVEKTLTFVRQFVPDAKTDCHHVEFGQMNGVEVEVHFSPAFVNNPIHNRRMQRWFAQMVNEQFSHVAELPDGVGTVSVPTTAFNRIFLLAHLSHHLFYEGIGLRQVVDYYYVIKQGFTEEERREDERLLKWLGLYDVAGAVMYVLGEVLHSSEKEMIVPADERRGRFLLNEIMQSGNMGKYDERVSSRGNKVARNWWRLVRDMRMVWYFPSECLWEPFFRFYHYCWRKKHNRVR